MDLALPLATRKRNFRMDTSIPKPRARRRPPIWLRCSQCGADYRIRASHAAASSFCSLACKNLSLRSLPDLTLRVCAWCGFEFMPPKRRSRPMKFCSRECSAHHLTATPYSDEWYAKVRAAAIESGNRQRGKGEGRSYRKLNGRHEHRVVAEVKAGRPLRFVDVVHHIDGDIHNNDPSNLEITTRAAHMRKHGLGIPGQPPPWYTRKKEQEEQ